jgi:hypothetical protein
MFLRWASTVCINCEGVRLYKEVSWLAALKLQKTPIDSHYRF